MDLLVLPDMPQEVKAVFASYPTAAQAKLHILRRIVFEEESVLKLARFKRL